MRRIALTTFVFGAVLQATAQVADPAQAAAIFAQLQDTPTTAARFNLFNGRDYVFDFNAGVGVTEGAGGSLTVANVADFPFLFGKGMSLAVGKMGPCGLATPHYHPRAAEFLYMLTGSNLKVGFILENGIRFVSNTLNPGQGAVFPKGSFHYQANLDCDPVTFVAGLNNEEPGVTTVGQRFFGIPPDVVDATLGDIGVDEVVSIAKSIPDTFALGIQACLDKCKIKPTGQPTTQQQPRVGGNEFPTTTTNNTTNTNSTKPSDKPTPSGNPPPSSKGEGDYNQPPPNKDYNSNGDDKNSPSPPPSGNWWEQQKDNSGKNSNGGSNDGQWDEKKWGDDKSKWNQGVDDSKWDEEEYGWKNYKNGKRSEVPEDRISALSSLIASANAQTVEELVFFLKLVLGVMLSGYVFVWVYFVIPTWRNRKLQSELQARAAAAAAAAPPVPVQDVKQ